MTTTALRQWHLTVHGAPRTKKNHGKVVWRMRKGKPHKYHVPSEQWSDWCENAPIKGNARGLKPTDELNLRAHFYRDADRGDLFGYLQGLADLLEKRGVVFNDSQFKQSDGSRLFVDRENPRVEVVLEEVA